MQTKNAIKYLVDIYRAVFKNNNIIKNFNYMALVTVLVAGVISSACSTTRIEVHPNSSLNVGSQDDWIIPIITDGTNLVINIVKVHPEALFLHDVGVQEYLWLEVPQEGLDINENEITIKEWSRLAYVKLGQSLYFSLNGSGVLKIRKQKTSFHGTASFYFTDIMIDPHTNPSTLESNIDWTF